MPATRPIPYIEIHACGLKKNEQRDMQDELETITNLARRALTEEDGVTAIEYGLLAALIAVSCVVVLTATGVSLEAIYISWSGAVTAAL